MSQASVYVQALDGLLYKDPVIVGDDWFVCFDDDEPPEIVMKRHGSTTEKSARRAAHIRLLGAGIGFTLGEINSLKNGRSFPPTWKPKPASSIFFTLLSPIPVPREYGGVKITPARVNATMYIFWHNFDTRAVLETLLGLEVDVFLAASAIPWGETYSQERLQETIYKQYPLLRMVTRENYEEHLLQGPKKLRIRWQPRESSSAIADSGS